MHLHMQSECTHKIQENPDPNQNNAVNLKIPRITEEEHAFSAMVRILTRIINAHRRRNPMNVSIVEDRIHIMENVLQEIMNVKNATEEVTTRKNAKPRNR